MSIAERMPADVPHPSVYIIEEMEERGWTRDDLALRMIANSDDDFGVVRLALDMYLELGADEPNMRIGNQCAVQMARAFDVSHELFLNMEAAWVKAHRPAPQAEGEGDG